MHFALVPQVKNKHRPAERSGFQEKMMLHIKTIELKAELEAKHALLETLIHEKQKVEHERDREVMSAACNCSVDEHESSDTDDNDEEKCCLGRVFYTPLNTILEKNTVDEKDIEEGFRDEEFQHTMARIKIIELRAELEAKRALLQTLIREKHGASDADEKDENFIACAKRESQIPFARHSVISYTSESAHDEPEGGKTNTKVGFFKSLAHSIRTKREEARPRQEILELLFIE